MKLKEKRDGTAITVWWLSTISSVLYHCLKNPFQTRLTRLLLRWDTRKSEISFWKTRPSRMRTSESLRR